MIAFSKQHNKGSRGQASGTGKWPCAQQHAHKQFPALPLRIADPEFPKPNQPNLDWHLLQHELFGKQLLSRGGEAQRREKQLRVRDISETGLEKAVDHGKLILVVQWP
jgi:hypothetical protein